MYTVQASGRICCHLIVWNEIVSFMKTISENGNTEKRKYGNVSKTCYSGRFILIYAREIEIII